MDGSPERDSEFFHLARMTRAIVLGLRSHGDTPGQASSKVLLALKRATFELYDYDSFHTPVVSGGMPHSFLSMKEALRQSLSDDEFLLRDKGAGSRAADVVLRTLEAARHESLPDFPLPVWRD
jgi:hypothetical protein